MKKLLLVAIMAAAGIAAAVAQPRQSVQILVMVWTSLISTHWVRIT